MSNSTLYIAAAGSGKTTLLVDQVEHEYNNSLPKNKSIAVVTFTVNNQDNIRARLENDFAIIPTAIQVMGWYSFVLNYWIKPFKGDVVEELYNHHVGLVKVESTSGLKRGKDGKYYQMYSKNDNPRQYFMSTERNIYSDKLSEMAYECYKENKDTMIGRLSDIFSSIYIDEVQDMAAWDYELLKVIAKSRDINLLMYGDPRQSTISTSNGRKNKNYQGRPDIYFREQVNTKRKTYVTIDETTLSHSHRCIDAICDFANIIMPDFSKSHMCHCEDCESKRRSYHLPMGMFILHQKDVDAFIETYHPITLVPDKNYNSQVKTPIHFNYGESKGLQADASMIYLSKRLMDYLRKDIDLAPLTQKKFYVAVTRARFACALVVPDDFGENRFGIPEYANGEIVSHG